MFILISCDKQDSIDLKQSREEIIQNWASQYFADYEEIFPYSLAEFTQAAVASHYNCQKVIGTFQIDTFDLILETSFHPHLEEVTAFTNTIIDHLDPIVGKLETKFAGVIVRPLRINGKMYTRTLVLSEKQKSIISRTDGCGYESDHHWSDGESCTQDKAYEKLMDGFASGCYWSHTDLSPCSFPSNIVYAIAPNLGNLLNEEFNLPCTTFSECEGLLGTPSLNPGLCEIAPNSPMCYDILFNNDQDLPKYKLFFRSNLESECITANEMDLYQELLANLARDILYDDVELRFNLNSDIWNYHSAVLESQPFGSNIHKGYIIYTRCAPNLWDGGL